MTKDEIDQREHDSQKTADIAKENIIRFKSSDMDSDKLEFRVSTIAQLVGVTRTSVFAAGVYAAMFAQMVGLSKEQMIGMFTETFDAIAKLPTTSKVATEYLEHNTKQISEQKTLEMMPVGTKVH